MRLSTDREIHFHHSLLLAEEGILLTVNTMNRRTKHRDEVVSLCAEMSLRALNRLEWEMLSKVRDPRPGRDKP